MTNEELLKLAEECGFEHFGMLNVPALEFNPAVRDMCAAGRCGMYGKCWTCPPGCGTLEEIAARAVQYKRGVLLQTTGELEDDFDVEVMMDSEKIQKERFKNFVTELRKTYPNCLPMSSGACTMCPTCTYPDEPCRAPHLAIPSMEAYGLVVSKTCEDSGMKYYYGPLTITYSGCVLVD